MTAQATPFRTIGEATPPDGRSERSSQPLAVAAGIIAFLGLIVLFSAGLGVGVSIGLAIHLLSLATLGAGGMIVLAARSLPDDERGPWTAIGAGIAIAGFGQVIEAVLTQMVAAVRNAPDVFSIAAVVVLAVGLIRLPHVRSTRIGTLRIALDVVVAMVSASTVLWVVVSDVFDKGAAAPFLHAMLFGAMFVAFLRRSPYVRDTRLGVLSVGLLSVVTTVDLTTSFRSASSVARWSLAVMLFAGVIWLLQRPQPRRSRVLARPGKRQLVIPGVPVTLFGLVVAGRVIDGVELAGTVIPWSIVLVSFGLGLRSAVAIVENRQLMALERDQLLASLSHELRTPLTAVSGFSQILTSNWDAVADHERRELIELVGDQADALVEIVSDLNALARSELDAAEPDLERVDGKVLIADAIKLVFDLDRPLPIKAEVEPYLELLCDRRRMVQVLRALFENALRYGNGQILVVAKRTKAGRVIEVHDDGAGVEKRYERVIWKRFERGAHELNANVPGSGLGLAIVRDIARSHHGEATYRRSERLGGACFAVELPYDKEADLRSLG
jgi:signal transduction histidine kinase